MEDKQQRTYGLLTLLLDQCVEELSSVVAEETATSPCSSGSKTTWTGLRPQGGEPEALRLDQECGQDSIF